MDQGTKDTLKKVADYADAEKKRLARRMCDMTAGVLDRIREAKLSWMAKRKNK